MENGALKIIVGSALFALIPVGVKMAGSAGLASLLFGRMLIASITIFIFSGERRSLFSIRSTDVFLLVIWALIMLGAMLAYFQAIRLSGVAIPAALLGAQPMLILLLASFFLKERMDGKRFFYTVLTVAGIALMSDLSGSSGVLPMGALLALLSALLLSMIFIFQKKFLGHLSSDKLVFFQCLFQLPFIVPLFFFFGIQFNLPVVYSSLLLGVVCTAMSYYLIYSGVKSVETYKIGILQSIEYVLPVIIGVFAYNESLDPKVMIGILLILISCILVQLKPVKEQ